MADHEEQQPQVADEQVELGRDKVKMTLPGRHIHKFQTIVDLLESVEVAKGEDSEPVPLPTVPPETFARLLEFADAHGDARVGEDLEEWKKQPVPAEDKRWLDTSTRAGVDATVAFLNAANYLNYACGFQHACRAIARMITDNTPQETLELMGHAPTLTQAEIDEAKKTYDWLADVQVPPELTMENEPSES
jgi:hypothetical protein